jgi:hypothetical protein
LPASSQNMPSDATPGSPAGSSSALPPFYSPKTEAYIASITQQTTRDLSVYSIASIAH